MGRRKPSGRRNSRSKMLDTGVGVLLLGTLFLVVPHFIRNPLVSKALGEGWHSAGWTAVLIGLGFIGLHFFVRSRQLQAVRPSDSTRSARPESPLRRERPVADTRVQAPAASAAWRPPVAPARSVQDEGPATGRRRESDWNAKVLADIEWRRFEAVCETLFAQGGFETRSQSHGADGGVDIWLHSKNSTGPAAIVQCKHWTKPVGVKEVREFFGVMASHRLQRGTYVATSGFTPDAQKFAKENGINAMAGDRLLALIATRTPEQQQQLLEVAYEGEYWRPTCASCGPKMVERSSSKGRSPFWGCVNYPRCRSTLPMRQPA
jgi:restriction system protein